MDRDLVVLYVTTRCVREVDLSTDPVKLDLEPERALADPRQAGGGPVPTGGVQRRAARGRHSGVCSLQGMHYRNVTTTMTTPRLRGSCLCGSASYDVSDDFEYCLVCHCSNCRRSTGAGSKPFAANLADRLTVHDDEQIMRYGDVSGHDAHCKHCGSLLYSLVRDGAYVHVTMGTLIDSPTIRPSAHIFVGSKAPWDTICDGLPQFDGSPGD